MINLELCSLHFQETQNLESIHSFLLFGDGCATSLICAGNLGFAIDGFRAIHDAGDPQPDPVVHWRYGI